MSEFRQSYNFGTMLLLGIGLMSLFFGLALLMERETVTSLFFGAASSPDLGAANVERLKILYVDCGAILAMAQGTILFVVGLFRLARAERAWSSATTPASR
jgi:hypothetical protein